MAACGALFVWFLVEANKKIQLLMHKIFTIFKPLRVSELSRISKRTFMLVRVTNKWGWVALLHNIHARFINIISFLHNKFSIIIFQRKARWKILLESLSLVGGLRIFFIIIKLTKILLRWGFFIIVIFLKLRWISDYDYTWWTDIN